MAQQRLRVRRLTDEEGRQLQRIVRRGGGRIDKSIVKLREMIHRFNEMGMASLDPKWAGGRSRRITIDDETFIVKTAKARPEAVGREGCNVSVWQPMPAPFADHPRPEEWRVALGSRHGYLFARGASPEVPTLSQ